MTGLTGGLIAFVLTLAVSPFVLRVLRGLRLIDAPNARSLHDEPIPRGGGLAVAVGAIVGVLLPPSSLGEKVLLTGAISFGLLGLVDDFHHLHAFTRLGIQGLLAGALIPLLLPEVTGAQPFGMILGCLILLWIISFVNAFNFMDGINGISAAQAIIAGTYLGVVGGSTGNSGLSTGGFVIAGAVAAFAPFNFPRARVFLGDVGSYFIGAWIAILVVLGVRAGLVVESVLAPVALYLADTLFAIVRRVLRGERWYMPHRDHVYQRLVALGWTHPRTTAFVGTLIALCSALGAAVLLLRSGLGRLAADLGIAVLLLLYLVTPARVRSRRQQEPEPGSQTPAKAHLRSDQG